MILNGSDIMAFVQLDGNGDKYVSLGGATSHTLSLNLDLQDFATKDFGGGSKNGRFSMKYPGLISFTITSDNYVIDESSIGDETSYSDNKLQGVGFDALMDAFLQRKPVKVVYALEGSSKSLLDDKLAAVGDGGWVPAKTYYSAFCYISQLTQNAPANDWATYTIEFQGHGEIKKVGTGEVFDTSSRQPATASLNASASKPVATATAK